MSVLNMTAVQSPIGLVADPGYTAQRCSSDSMHAWTRHWMA